MSAFKTCDVRSERQPPSHPIESLTGQHVDKMLGHDRVKHVQRYNKWRHHLAAETLFHCRVALPQGHAKCNRHRQERVHPAKEDKPEIGGFVRSPQPELVQEAIQGHCAPVRRGDVHVHGQRRQEIRDIERRSHGVHRPEQPAHEDGARGGKSGVAQHDLQQHDVDLGDPRKMEGATNSVQDVRDKQGSGEHKHANDQQNRHARYARRTVRRRKELRLAASAHHASVVTRTGVVASAGVVAALRHHGFALDILELPEPGIGQWLCSISILAIGILRACLAHGLPL
mmetsp:Transcript_16268/g.41539  ORF Transcript_16268/g.41539 Transcript_16268/m.41539 type:complete len:285 (-) Transcript_16268:1087-1941(-)